MKTLTALLGVLAACSLLAAEFASPPPKSIAIEAMMDIFTRRDATAVDRYFGEPYIQHNLAIPDGLGALRTLAANAAKYPKGKTTIHRAIADGDLVLLHSVYEGIPRFDEKPVVAVDLFRFRDGRIVEHWDALTFIVPANADGHTQFDGVTQILDPAQTEANRALVRRFVDRVLIGEAHGELPQYIDVRRYAEHTPKAADSLLALGSSTPSRRTQVLHRVIAEGNFVVTQSEGLHEDKPAALYDIFRIDNGRIVEHWDVLAPLLPRDKWAHDNGAF